MVIWHRVLLLPAVHVSLGTVEREDTYYFEICPFLDVDHSSTNSWCHGKLLFYKDVISE